MAIKPVRIFSTNAQSLLHKITELDIEVQDVEVACVCETWLGPSDGQEDLKI